MGIFDHRVSHAAESVRKSSGQDEPDRGTSGDLADRVSETVQKAVVRVPSYTRKDGTRVDGYTYRTGNLRAMADQKLADLGNDMVPHAGSDPEAAKAVADELDRREINPQAAVRLRSGRNKARRTGNDRVTGVGQISDLSREVVFNGEPEDPSVSWPPDGQDTGKWTRGQLLELLFRTSRPQYLPPPARAESRA